MLTGLRQTVGLAVSALVLGTTACGGGAQQTERLSEAEWIAQADAICANGTAELEALGLPETGEELSAVSAEEFVELLDEASEIGDEQLDGLRELNPPAEAEADYTRLLDLTVLQVKATRDLRDATADGDTDAIPGLLQEIQSIEQEADAIIEQYPFEECGRS